MNRTIKIIMPVAASVLVILAGSHLRSGNGCPCSAPIALFGSILGCSGPAPDESALHAESSQQDAAGDSKLLAVLNRAAQQYSGPVKVTFVELGSVNCIPCKMMQPVMQKIEETYPGQVKVVFHDVWTDQGKPYAIKYGINGIPTQVFLDAQGNEYFRHTGYFPFEEIQKILNKKGVE